MTWTPRPAWTDQTLNRVPAIYPVCLNCGEALQFNDILVLKPLPKDVPLDARTKAMLERASAIVKERGRIWPR